MSTPELAQNDVGCLEGAESRFSDDSFGGEYARGCDNFMSNFAHLDPFM